MRSILPDRSAKARDIVIQNREYNRAFIARPLSSVREVAPADWRRILGSLVEGGEFFGACEQAPPPEFKLAAIGVFEKGVLRGGVPSFFTSFQLDLALPRAFKPLGRMLKRWFPRLVGVRLSGAGSPHTDELALAFDGLNPAEHGHVLDCIAATLEGHCEGGLICFKNVMDVDRAWVDPVLKARGYARIASLPIAVLDVPESEAAYMASLSANMRRSLKRKLRRARNIRVEVRNSVDGVESELAALREATRQRAGANYDVFEGVSPGFYRAVMQQLGDRSRLILYWRGSDLLGFSLILLEEGRLKEKYSGLRYPEALDYGIFFVNWMTLLRLCFELRLGRLHAGETTYVTKGRLGCRLLRSWIYVRDGGPVRNWLLLRVAPFISLAASDPDLKMLFSSRLASGDMG